MELVFNNLSSFILASVIIFAAEVIYVTFGFGAGLFSVGLLALILPSIRDCVVILLLINLPVEFIVILKSWEKLEWKGVFPIFLGLIPGILGGTYILKVFNPVFLLKILGIFLVVSGIIFAFNVHKRKKKLSFGSQVVVGLTSGVLAGMFGTGGPPIVFYFRYIDIPKFAFRGSLMSIFFLIGLLRIPTYWQAGLFTAPRFYSSLALFPIVVIGFWIGSRIHLELKEKTFKRLVGIMLTILGISLIIGKG